MDVDNKQIFSVQDDANVLIRLRLFWLPSSAITTDRKREHYEFDLARQGEAKANLERINGAQLLDVLLAQEVEGYEVFWRALAGRGSRK